MMVLLSRWRRYGLLVIYGIHHTWLNLLKHLCYFMINSEGETEKTSVMPLGVEEQVSPPRL